jgi:hypothetical protein
MGATLGVLLGPEGHGVDVAICNLLNLSHQTYTIKFWNFAEG